MDRTGLIWIMAPWIVLILGCETSPTSPGKEPLAMFAKLTPNLMVPDVNRTVEYYHEILGFDFIMGVPPASQEIVTKYDSAKPLAFALMQQGGVQFMFQSQQSFIEELPSARDKSVGASATFYIEISNARELYQQLQGRTNILSQLKGTFYGKEEFCVADLNGYILCFAGEPEKKTP